MKAVETSNFAETKHWTTVSREQICGQWSNVKVTGIKNVKKNPFFAHIVAKMDRLMSNQDPK